MKKFTDYTKRPDVNKTGMAENIPVSPQHLNKVLRTKKISNSLINKLIAHFSLKIAEIKEVVLELETLKK